MTPLRVVIVDDEPPARRRLRRLLRAVSGVEVVGEAGDGAAAVAQARVLAPDAVLLDIQMPGPDGLDVVLRLPRPRPHVIFVTAHDRHAVRAFELHALDYLLKPVSGPRLAEAIARVRAAGRRPVADERLEAWRAWTHGRGSVRRLPVRSTGRLELVDVSSIDWIEAADNYVLLHCGSRTHILRETMAALAGRLDPGAFLRVHRSTIVQTSRIVRLEPLSRGDWRIVLQDGTAVVLSRTYRRDVIAAVGAPAAAP